MKLLLNVLICMPLMGLCQGMHFENGLSWGQVLEKAKAENKYIFVDCYASWCGPCKMMDRDVYSNDTIGRFFHNRFISVKIQMDTSKRDDEMVRAWYSEAHKMMYAYKVAAYPTFLFFSPDGKIVHRGVGFHNVQRFIKLASEASDPAKQYYTLMGQYKSGALNYPELPILAYEARSFGDKKDADLIAKDYMQNYLAKLDSSDFYKEQQLEFVSDFRQMINSQDRVFDLIFSHMNLADSIVRHGDYIKPLVDFVITKEEIKPLEDSARKYGEEPNWAKIESNIKSKYNADYAEHVVLDCRVNWYKAANDWSNYIKYLIIQMDVRGFKDTPPGLLGAIILNHNAWTVFEHSNSKEELLKAISWSNEALERDPKPASLFIDTKANLLYKLGKKDEAIILETKASQLGPTVKDISLNLAKMRNGVPTW